MNSRRVSFFVSVILVPAFACAQSDAPAAGLARETQSQTLVNATTHRPRTLTFRGTLKDRENADLMGVVGVLFTINAEKEAGPILWQEVQNVTPGKGGAFSVELGASADEGVPREVFAQNETLWLAIHVLLPGEVEQPRLRMVSAGSELKLQTTSVSRASRAATVKRMSQESSDQTAESGAAEKTVTEPADQTRPTSEVR